MEREHPIQRSTPAGGGGPEPEADGLEQLRLESGEILEAMDRILDSVQVVNPEEYLQRNRQHGGQ
jgi:hypothetical protein